MPVDPSQKKAPTLQITQLPLVASVAALVTALNIRFREATTSFRSVLTNPAREEETWNLSYNRIENAGDPRNDLDVVNLRTLRKYISPQQVTQAQETSTTPEVQAITAYTMVFTKDGLVNDNEKSPSFTVNELRTGTIFAASLTAEIAPSVEALKVNFLVSIPGDDDDKKLFLDDHEITLEIGAKGPSHSVEFQIAKTLPKDTKVRMLIVKAGLSEQVVGELVIKGVK